MIVFNLNVSPDNGATATLPDGGYNFACITPEENAEILSLLKPAAEYPADQRGIALAFFSEATNHKPRYIINQIIIEYAKLSGTPLDVAAEFIALSRKSSTFRPKALEIFERIPKELCFPPAPYVNGRAMYSWSLMYLSAAEMYEKEYQYDKAINAIEESRRLGWYPDVCTKIHAEVLAKTDINSAVEYLENSIAADPSLSGLKSTLEEYKKKAEKGYQFKPRKARKEDNTEMEQQLRRLAYRYLKKE